MPAEDLAEALAARFLMEGNYESGPISLHAQPAGVEPIEEYFEADAGFSGLAVHSVGFTKGLEEPKVVIYVVKGSKRALQSLPDRIDDVDIEIDVMGKLKAAPASFGSGNLYERNGRIACGSSCAPGKETYAGTFGALVRDGANLLALSNNHVLAACNHTPQGMPIVSPSMIDTGAQRRGPTEIARHHQIIELRSGDPVLAPLNRLDVATAIITDPNIVTSWQGDHTEGFDTPTRIANPVSGMRVKKFGRTTGLTVGALHVYLNTRWYLPYQSARFKAWAWFIDTWTVRSVDTDPFALPGDSGSLIVTEDSNEAVGLLFAVNNRGEYGIIMPIGDVLAGLGNLELVSGHGV